MALKPSGEDRKERKIVLERRVEFELAILVIALVLFLKFFPRIKDLTKSFELKTVDLRFALRGARPVPDDVVLITIDDYSLSRLGQWPWPRRIHGQLVDRLRQLGAKAIMFDVLFVEPSRLGPRDDQYFARAIRDAGNVFLPIYNVSELEGVDASTLDTNVPERFLYPVDFRNKYRWKFEGGVPPLPLLSKYVRGAGTVTLAPDVDGLYRKLALLMGKAGREDFGYPHVGLEICRYVLGLQAKDVVIDEGGEIRLGDFIHIPVTGAQLVTLDFYDRKNRFPHISYADVFDDSKLAAANVNLANRVAIVGWSATGVVDLRPSPLDPTRPGVEHIATLVDNILKSNFMIESPEWVNVFMILLVGTIMAIIIIRLSPARGGTFTGVFLMAYVAIAFFFFKSRGIIIEMISPTLVIFLAYAAITAYRLGTEEKEKRHIRDTFGSYVTSQVVDELLKDPSKATLGGTRKEVSVLFADVRGFTSMSEKMAPERVVEYLNDLFQPMNDIIFEYEGTIDNIIGDCLMAVFNAPADQPDHAERAVQTGMAMLTEMKRLQQEWQSQGRPLLSMGIGINTGEVVVGNVGSASRKQYTVIGDEVNLAARLESLTRQYKVDIIIGEATYEVVQAQVRARPLGEVIVKGKTQPVTIYEVLAVDGSGALEPGPVPEGQGKQADPSAGASVQVPPTSTPTQPPRSS